MESVLISVSRYMVLQIDESYEPPATEQRMVYGIQLQVCKSIPFHVLLNKWMLLQESLPKCLEKLSLRPHMRN